MEPVFYFVVFSGIHKISTAAGGLAATATGTAADRKIASLSLVGQVNANREPTGRAWWYPASQNVCGLAARRTGLIRVDVEHGGTPFRGAQWGAET